MEKEKKHRSEHYERKPSSFFMHDPYLIFEELDLKEGDSFLDLGCGTGDYTLWAANKVGLSGTVYALDIQERLIKDLVREASIQKITNISAIVSDICRSLPISDDSIDVVFIATVLHSLNLESVGENIFNEISRVLKQNGHLAIIECKKENTLWGPPVVMRKSSEEIETLVAPFGFKKISYKDLGYNYMIQFSLRA
ncbi:class I SAM-dependent methyltransferase [Aminobacterium sp. MB27-C1]|uniref:class I SAM-dependent methyltransferase n=1 Tax=Aminobacterium sp. MB27-C1 TaxID=3070661 RepID=UPI0027DC302C|nr:class I SAM-dependent methyltransferase [Aminobacterium sp. MB27-C1]WMI70534.1 class I SAM-dependent methyltransferase [Aminobacterium sp. MB27-C1]